MINILKKKMKVYVQFVEKKKKLEIYFIISKKHTVNII